MSAPKTPAGFKAKGKVRTAERKARLARALRENLKKRRDQARARGKG
jgi:hypothetical protein